jgi:hypothetical protein
VTENQEKILVRVIIGGIVLIVLGAVAWAANNRKVGVVGGMPDNCVEDGFIIPPVDIFWGFSHELIPEVTAESVNGWLEYDERVILHVMFADTREYHFILHAMCTDEAGLLYPLIEAVQIK